MAVVALAAVGAFVVWRDKAMAHEEIGEDDRHVGLEEGLLDLALDQVDDLVDRQQLKGLHFAVDLHAAREPDAQSPEGTLGAVTSGSSEVQALERKGTGTGRKSAGQRRSNV